MKGILVSRDEAASASFTENGLPTVVWRVTKVSTGEHLGSVYVDGERTEYVASRSIYGPACNLVKNLWEATDRIVEEHGVK